MRGTPPKGSWGTGYIIEPRPNNKRISCSFCKYYNEDGSCMAKPIVIWEVGYDYWKHCRNFHLKNHYDTPKNRATVNRIKRTHSPYIDQDSTDQISPKKKEKKNKELLREKKYKAIPRGVQLGTVVRVMDMTYDEIVQYEIVKSKDADVMTGKISIDSPVGQGLMGAEEGRICKINTPDGMMKYKVLKIK